MGNFVQKPGILSREIAGETLLVPIRGNIADMQKLFALNEVGALIWEKLDGTHDEADICNAIEDVFNVDATTARKDYHQFIDELKTAGLIEVSD